MDVTIVNDITRSHSPFPDPDLSFSVRGPQKGRVDYVNITRPVDDGCGSTRTAIAWARAGDCLGTVVEGRKHLGGVSTRR